MSEKLQIEPYAIIKSLMVNIESGKINGHKGVETIIELIENRELTPTELKDAFTEIDQSRQDREDSILITKLMRSKKLENHLKLNYPEFMISFYRSRTFEQFHAFQVLVNNEKTKQIAIKLLEASVKDSEKSISLNPDKDKGQLDWNSYVKMTLDYMSNNYESFVSIGGEIDLNKTVYDRMKRGWDKFGTTDYLRDYMGARRNGDILFID